MGDLELSISCVIMCICNILERHFFRFFFFSGLTTYIRVKANRNFMSCCKCTTIGPLELVHFHFNTESCKHNTQVSPKYIVAGVSSRTPMTTEVLSKCRTPACHPCQHLEVLRRRFWNVEMQKRREKKKNIMFDFNNP